jgi:hypothetical protein
VPPQEATWPHVVPTLAPAKSLLPRIQYGKLYNVNVNVKVNVTMYKDSYNGKQSCPRGRLLNYTVNYTVYKDS